MMGIQLIDVGEYQLIDDEDITNRWWEYELVDDRGIWTNRWRE